MTARRARGTKVSDDRKTADEPTAVNTSASVMYDPTKPPTPTAAACIVATGVKKKIKQSPAMHSPLSFASPLNDTHTHTHTHTHTAPGS